MGKPTLRRIISVFLAALMMFSILPVSAYADATVTEDAAESVILQPQVGHEEAEGLAATPAGTRWALTLEIGASKYARINGVTITSASSSNKSVATVSKSGKISAKKTGSAVITLSNKAGEKYYCDLTVIGKLNQTEVKLAVGDNTTVKLIGTKVVSVSSENSGIAEITPAGKITANAAGRTTVSFIGSDGVTYPCTVTVESPRLREMTVVMGRKLMIPVSGNTQSITWKSSSSIVSISKSGELTAKKVGTCTITAKVASGKKISTTVTVVPGFGSDEIRMAVDDTRNISVNGVAVKSLESSDTDILDVSQNKKIWVAKALSEGTAVVTATDSLDAQYTCTIIVEKPSLVSAEAPDVSCSALTLNQGDAIQLQTVGTRQNLKWKSSKSSVVAVDAQGLVTAKKAGSAVISVQLESGKLLSVPVTVLPVLTKANIILGTGDSTTLKLTSGSIVRADSSQPDIVTVTSRGKVTAVAPGEAAITVYDAKNNAYICNVVSEDPVLSETNVTLGVGRTLLLKLNGTQQSYKWRSSGAASVDSKGLLTAKKVGSGHVYATLASGKKITANVTVVPTISASELAVALGDKVPSLKLAGTSAVAYSSSDESVATISNKGVITPKAVGTTVLTLKGKDRKDYCCTLSVEDPVMENPDVTVTVGMSETLTLLGNSQLVTWTSGNKRIAQVNASGNVQGMKAGTTTITAKLASGRTFTFHVTVAEKKQFTVSFETNGAAPIPTQTVLEGKTAQAPAVPEREDYIFQSWYSDPDLTVEYNFSARVKENITLYARWIPKSGDDDSAITRGEWVARLAELIDMNLDVSDPSQIDYYYADTAQSPYGIAIETAQRYGLLPDVVLEDAIQDVPMFYPDQPATREFVAFTTARALGGTETMPITCADMDEITCLGEVSYVVNNDILRLVNNKFLPAVYLSQDDLTVALAGIARVLSAATVTEERLEYSYAPGALKKQFEGVTDYVFADNGDDTYELTMKKTSAAIQVRKDNVIIMPANDEHPAGAMLKVSSIILSGDDIIFKGVKPKFEEVFTSFEFAGYGGAEFVEVEAAEGFTAHYSESGTIEKEESPVSSHSYDGELPDAKRFGGSIEVPGKLVFETDSAEIWGGELSGSIEVTIPDITCIADIEASLWEGINVNEFVISLTSELKISGELKYTLTESGYKAGSGRFISCRKEIGCATFLLPGGFSFDIQFFINYSANGTISISYTVRTTLGYAYSGGSARLIHSFADSLNALDLRGSASLTVGLAPAIGYAGIFELIGFTAEVGPAFDASVTVHTLATDTLTCVDATLYLLAKIGLDKQTIIGKAISEFIKLGKVTGGITLEYEILGNNADNPVKAKFHLENLRRVDECTFGMGRLEGKVISAATKQPIFGARVEIYDQYSNLIRTKYTDSSGLYQMDNLDSGTYSVAISANGYQRYDTTAVIENGLITYLQTAEMVARTNDIGVIRLEVVDATNNRPLDGVSYTVHKGWNSPAGEVIKSGVVYSSTFELELEAGNYTVVLCKDTYSNANANIAVVANTSKEQKIFMSPANQSGLDGDNMRIVLTWGDTPSDLDSHLVGPTADGSDNKYHIFFADRYYGGGVCDTNLDVDVVTGYGPETITINGFSNGLYSYSVHDYTNKYSPLSQYLSSSGAMVQVYMGNNLVRTFNVPVNKYGTVWHVFDYDPVTKTIIPSNEFLSVTDPFNVGFYADRLGKLSENMEVLMQDLANLIEKETVSEGAADVPLITEDTEPTEVLTETEADDADELLLDEQAMAETVPDINIEESQTLISAVDAA